MPDSHVPMPGETYLLPEEMPAAAATIQEGICYCIMSNPPTLTLHWQCSSPQGPTRVFRLYLSLYMLMYKKQTWRQSSFILKRRCGMALQRRFCVYVLPILEHCSTSFLHKAEMPENHVQVPGETCLLPGEMPPVSVGCFREATHNWQASQHRRQESNAILDLCIYVYVYIYICVVRPMLKLA